MCEKTEGSTFEFIGYQIPPHRQDGSTVLFTMQGINQHKCVGLY